MRFKLSHAISILFAIFYSAGIFASTPAVPMYYQEFHDSDAVRAYWTPERLKNAKPLPWNVDPAKIKRISIEELLAEQNGDKPTGREGSPPKIPIKPVVNYLYVPDKKTISTFKSFDQGTLNEPYSSSQLIPTTADQTYPYVTVGRLFFTISGQGNFVCSAATQSFRIVVTAGHCVHSGVNGSSGFYTNFLFVPAFDNGNAPFGSWTSSLVTATNVWMTSGGVLPNAADFGMLQMVDQTVSGTVKRIGDVIGFLGFLTQSTMPNHVNMLGFACNLDNCQLMHQVSSQSAAAISPSNVQYGSDMLGGSDGGPWLQNFGNPSAGQTNGTNTAQNRVVGITSIGFPGTTQMGLMSSLVDNTNFLGLFNTICANQSGNCS